MTLALLGGNPVRRGGEADWPILDDGLRDAFDDLLRTGDWGRYLGPHCEALREALEAAHRDTTEGDDAFCEVRLCSSGTAAVLLALVGVDVRAGDEVILSAYDFKANLTNVRSLDAVPVLVDCRRDDAQLDAAGLDAAITPKTRAVLVSHLHGGSVRMSDVLEIVRKHERALGRRIAIIEDICQNPLAIVDGRTAGCWGDVATLSFGGSKLLTAGRGGAAISRDPLVAGRIRRYAERGNDVSPLSEMQAALLPPQLRTLPDRAARRREAARWLADACAAYGLVAIDTRESSAACEPDFYKVGFYYDAAAMNGLGRARFCEAMHAENITLSPAFPALHKTHSARTFRAAGPLDEAERAGRSLVTLHHPILLDGPDGWQQVVDAAAKIQQHCRTHGADW